ncbi:MAG: H-N-H endonuclease F-TflIV [Candidatus Gottesmanbacteria bacterium GW2011_GWB1_43_11]|uniref:H-N-H endonuclease F-TflIV n=1 Tax=Candidatus Gottesmanbacteria bacterium GW2011_GWB1_43_11 TaxID=1618446 RepID=A0A0G1CGR7_9BACT|nr:MAG: H-N-H endonuclease F-TflIV [Candidatus Gottesmanbacteria bacterium GW2011_GWB1_43_11]
MPKKRTWTIQQLKDAVKNSPSYRQVLTKLHLREAGGNYDQLKKYVRELNLNIGHFTGKVWNKGLRGIGKPLHTLEEVLVLGSTYQSYSLKRRLFKSNLKSKECEKCGWAKKAVDGRLPLELDHINGDRHDNRLENLRILCPNCHSLEPTHRGRNRSKNLKKIFVEPGW